MAIQFDPNHTPDAELDARDMLCPLPVLKARKRLMAMAPGQVLRVLTTDPVAVIDMPHFCAQTGHTYLAATETDGVTVHLLQCAVANGVGS